MAVLALGLSAGVVVPVGAVEGVLTPTGLSASSAAGGVLLEWDAPVQDAGSVTGYRIVRRRTDVGEKRLSQLVRDTGTTSTSYLDESAFDGGVYIYRVRAMRGGLRSAISDKATITYKPPADEPAPVDTSDLSGPRSDLSGPKSDADDPVAAGVSPVWSAVLTVDAYGGSSPPSLGFWEWSRSDVGSATGGLSERHFEVGDSGITVAALFEYVEGGLMMGLSAELPEDFVLDVDGEQFVGSESFVPGLILRGRYWWPAAPRDWRTGDQVPVSITMGGPGDLTGRPKAPPSARFSHLPAGHNGIDAFTVRLNFDEAGLAVDAAMLRDDTLEVAGAGIAEVKKASAGKRAWDITLEPHGPEEIIVALGPVGGCALLGAVCTSDGRELHNHAQVVIAGLADASLASLDLMGASLGAPFDPAEALHYATSAPGASEFTVLAAAAEESAGAEVSITPADADPGEPGHQVVVDPNGETAVELTVTAPDGVATRRYWLVARSDTASGDESSALENMQMSGLEPLAFNEKESLYVLSVHEEVSQTTVVTSRAETDAIVEVMVVRSDSAKLTLDRNDADPAAIGHQVDLADSGDTLVIVRVTSGDGLSQRVYLTLISKVSTSVRSSMRQLTMRSKLTMRSETAPTLSSLSVSEGSLDPAFAADEFEYTATVESDVAEVTVTAAANGAELTVIPADADANDPGHQVALGLPGSETAIVIVASANGQLVSYVVTVSRKASTRLALLDVSGSQLTPAFDPDLYAYTATVDDTQSHATIHATAEAPDAEVRIVPGDDDPVTPGHQVALGALGDLTTTQVVVLVSAPTVAAHGTYMIAVTRPELVPSLGSLSVAGLDLTPAFDSDVFEYAVAAGPELAEATLSATASYPHMDITVSLADADPNKPGWQIPLGALGSQTVTTAVVTVTDSSTTSSSYTVVFTRAAAPPQHYAPSNLILTSMAGGIRLRWEAPAVDGSSVTGYEIVRRQSGAGQTGSQALAQTDESVTEYLDGTVAVGGEYFYEVFAVRGPQTSLGSGETGAEHNPQMATLRSIASRHNTLIPAFDPDIVEYELRTPHSATTVSLDVDTTHSSSVFTIGSNNDPSVSGTTVDLHGNDVITIVVSGAGRLPVTYTINVTISADVSVSEGGQDFPSNTSTHGRVAVGGSANAYMSDSDWIAMDLEVGKVYRINLEGHLNRFNERPNLELISIRNRNGVSIAGTSDRDSGGNNINEFPQSRDSQLYFFPNYSGVHYVHADHHSSWQHGPYTVSVTEIPYEDDIPADLSTSETLTVGVPTGGEIEIADDRDWFRVSLLADTMYWIEVKGKPTSSGTLRDPRLAWVHDASGVRIPGTNTETGGPQSPPWYSSDNNARLAFTPSTAGIYYISAAGNPNDSWAHHVGTYEVLVTAVSDDFAADTTTTGVIEVGGKVKGIFEQNSDSDWFAVDLVAGTLYQIDLTGDNSHAAGPAGLPVIKGVYDSSGNKIPGTSSSYSISLNNKTRVVFTPADSGIHYVSAGKAPGYELHSLGGYILKFKAFTDDCSADIDTGCAVAGPHKTIRGELEIRGDVDWYAVELDADVEYWIHIKGKGREYVTGFTVGNPNLKGVYDSVGNMIPGTAADNGTVHYDSLLKFTPTETGTHYVAVTYSSSWDFPSLGTYGVEYGRVTDDFSANTTTTGTVDVDGSATGMISIVGDRDWFRVTLIPGNTYRIDIEGSATGMGTIYSPNLTGIHDSTGQKIANTSNDFGGVNSNAKLIFRANNENLTHYISVTGGASALGSYTVTVTLRS